VSRFYPDKPDLANLLVLAATEMTSESDMDALVAALKEVL
jgi:glycine dehydrogenase subunit 1